MEIAGVREARDEIAAVNGHLSDRTHDVNQHSEQRTALNYLAMSVKSPREQRPANSMFYAGEIDGAAGCGYGFHSRASRFASAICSLVNSLSQVSRIFFCSG